MSIKRFILLVCFFWVSAIFASPQEDFFQSILPAVKKTHQVVMAQRGELKTLYALFKKNKQLTPSEKDVVLTIAKAYNLKNMNPLKDADWKSLLTRVDVIPTSMVLAQAADESAWGRSRFARLGYNYFGQWCFHRGCGIVPKDRPRGAIHEVQRFKNRQDAIEHYFHNLNTGQAYETLRAIRAKSRLQGKALSGVEIARGLVHYSALGQRYVSDIQHIIRRYHLERFD